MHGLPDALLSWWLLGRWSTPHWRSRLRDALTGVSADALRARIAAVLQVDVSALLSQLQVPLLALRASADRIVPRAAARHIVATAPHASLVDVEGPHFLLQAVPAECARAVQRFVDALDDEVPGGGRAQPRR